MARKLRVQYSGAICQVMNRGDRWEDIFQREELTRLGICPVKAVRLLCCWGVSWFDLPFLAGMAFD